MLLRNQFEGERQKNGMQQTGHSKAFQYMLHRTASDHLTRPAILPIDCLLGLQRQKNKMSSGGDCWVRLRNHFDVSH